MITFLSAFGLPGCLPDHVSATQWRYWVPGATFELTLVSLAVAKLFQVARAKNSPPRLLQVLLRDSVLYFGGFFATLLCSLVIWTCARVSPWSWCSSTVP